MSDDAADAAPEAPVDDAEPAAKRAKPTEAVDDDALPPMPKAWAGKDPGLAMLWYYADREGKRQGPFYPGQMRQWFAAGFFKPRQLVAPSFKGEVPRAFVRIAQFYAGAVQQEAAFVAREGIALWPTAQAPQPDPDDDPDGEVVRRGGVQRRPQWLEDSLRRQRAGIKRKMIYGPVERENYN